MRGLFFLWAVHGFAAFNLTWGNPAVELDSHPLLNDIDGNAAIATDPKGNAVATWSRTTGKGASEEIWAASYNHFLRVWTGAVKISGSESAVNSRVAVDAKGNAILVWDEGFPSQVMCRSLSAQGIWTPDLSLPSSRIQPSNRTQMSPQIGIDLAGNALIIWMEYFNKGYHILSAKKPLESAWMNLGEISSGKHPAALTTAKSVSINESGDAMAVWEESSSEIHGARYVGGAWLSPMAISAAKGQVAQFPSVGIDANGNGVIVWSEDKAVKSKVLIDGQLSAEPLIASNPAYPALHPDVGVDAAGNAVVVFERYNPVHKFVAGALLPFKAISWSAPVDISGPSPSTSSAAGHPVLSLNTIGDGVAIWFDDAESHLTIQGAGYALGTWSPGKILSLLNEASGTSIPTYAVSVNLTGNIMAVWPEPPSGVQPPQIKATPGVGLANIAPLPPLVDPITLTTGIIGVASGTQSLHRFPAHADLINTITWDSPGGVAYYKIYRNNFSALIGTSERPRYEDHQRIPKKNETYLITSVDRNGQESSPTTIIVHPRH